MRQSEATWAEANQRHLSTAVADVRRVLEQRAGSGGAPGDAPSPKPGEVYALDVVCAVFGLSSFERALLVLCAGMELDSSFGELCAAAHGDSRRAYPTFSLAFAILPDAHWSALSPAAPLRHWKLVELGARDLVTQAPLRIDERILQELTGLPHLDERLAAILEPVPIPDALPASQENLVRQIAVAWGAILQGATPTLVQLIGEAPVAKRAIAARACAALGLGLYALRSADVPIAADERDTLVRLWSREALLSRTALLVEAEEVEGVERARVFAFLERMPGFVLTMTREPLAGFRRPELRLQARRPHFDEQRALWRDHLGERAARLNGQVDALAVHFSLEAGSIRSACAEAIGAVEAGTVPEDTLGEAVWQACRAHARHRLDDLARRIESSVSWRDIVLPEAQALLLREIASQVRQRPRVYEAWGFGAAGSRGLGISALFAGPSGTGKTMAAEVLASELSLDLYHIDLSQVVSKYIGETEKNLRRVFDAAEGGGAILLFDEADALFGRRSEVKDSHDRYANIEVSYLLQRMESYRGLAILTTNLKSAVDPAFLRRLRFVVSFPFPDAVQREEIWRRVFPALTPREGLDPAKLARLDVAGGNIRNIALHAAFLAAAADQPVRMSHLARAARVEYTKLERILTEPEIAGWQ